jgi:hypothetical protein
MPLLSGQDVKRYSFPQKRQWIIFPYEKKGAKVVLIPPPKLENLYPHCFEYLKANRALLETRPRLRNSAERWVAFGQEKNLSLQRQPKLCVPRLCKRLSFLLEERGQWCQDNVDVCGVILKKRDKKQYYFVLGLLNSKVMDFYFRQISVPFRGEYYSANRQFLEPLPIHRIDFDNPAEKKLHDDLVAQVDKMLELNKRLAPIRNTPCNERDELLREINRTDKDIDNLVYELYGLTGEEREIIEGS